MIGAVDSPEDLAPAWLTSALRSAGHDHEITTVTYDRIGTGQLGATFRLRLEYRGEPGPSTLIAKLAAGDPATRGLIASGYAAEVGFYTHLASVLDVRTPKCWYGFITEDRTSFTLLLDDVAPAEVGTQASGCGPDQAAAALTNLVGLHAPLWSDPALELLPFLLRSDPDIAQMVQDILITATDGFIERYGIDASPEDASTLREVAHVIGTWFTTRTDPYSITHGDYRLDNLMFDLANEHVIAVDWQTVGVGPPARDVAYFLGTCLSPKDRRAHEEGLVAGYHEALVARGVKGYNADSCWTDYRLGQLHGPMITVLGCMLATAPRTEGSDAMFLAMASRSCVAIRELRSLELL